MEALLSTRTAVVTGGSSGIGRAIALAMAKHGAAVVVADVREAPRTADTASTLEAIADRTDASATFVECDVTDGDDVAAAVAAAEEFGGVDVMVNNAGVTIDAPLLESTEADYDALMDVNLKGVYLGCREAAKSMLETGGGSIVNVSSTAADRGYATGGSYLYAAAKGGVRSMTWSLAEILGPEIRVNAVQPGFTRETGLAGSGHDPDYVEARAKETAMDRLGVPDDVAGVAVFLASDLSAYVTAESILVDGGWVHTGGP